MRTFARKKTVSAKQTMRQKLAYVRKNWQLYVIFFNASSSFDDYF